MNGDTHSTLQNETQYPLASRLFENGFLQVSYFPLGTAVGLRRILIVLLVAVALHYKGKIKRRKSEASSPIKRKKGGTKMYLCNSPTMSFLCE